MSITVYRMRNGVQEPIKLSILDAFRGAPARKVSQSTTPWPSTTTSKPSVASQNKANKSVHFSTKDSEIYSESDDQTLMRMKAEGKSWKDILAALNKESKSQAQTRYKDLENKGIVARFMGTWDGKQGGEGKGGDSDGGAGAKRGKGSPGKKGARQQNNDSAKDANNGNGKKGGKKNKSNNETNPTTTNIPKPPKSNSSTTLGMVEGVSPDPKLVASLKRFADQYDEQKWVAVASRHYDRTGVRISGVRAEALYS